MLGRSVTLGQNLLKVLKRETFLNWRPLLCIGAREKEGWFAYKNFLESYETRYWSFPPVAIWKNKNQGWKISVLLVPPRYCPPFINNVFVAFESGGISSMKLIVWQEREFQVALIMEKLQVNAVKRLIVTDHSSEMLSELKAILFTIVLAKIPPLFAKFMPVWCSTFQKS